MAEGCVTSMIMMFWRTVNYFCVLIRNRIFWHGYFRSIWKGIPVYVSFCVLHAVSNKRYYNKQGLRKKQGSPTVTSDISAMVSGVQSWP